MWLMTTTGFFSVVQKPGEHHLTVRARVRHDLDALREVVPSMTVVQTTPRNDYAFRARVAHEDLARGLTELVTAIDYDNFKSAVAAAQGHKRSDVYSEVWSVLLRLQRAPRR